MPDFTAYPAVADVELLLKSAKYWPTDSDTTGVALAREQAAIAAAGASAEFERRTGWQPFLAAVDATTRTFDATDTEGYLDLSGGLLSEPTVTIGGATYAAGSQYWTFPNNAVSQGRPITALRFNSALFAGRTYGVPNRISVTGRWGYADTVPPDAWVAIQKKGAVETLASIENLQSIASISQDGFSKGYDVVGILTQKDIADRWGKDWEKQCFRFIRMTC